MSDFVITFDPALPRADEPVSVEWISRLDWSAIPALSEPLGRIDLIFWIHQQQFSYYPQGSDGLLIDLVEARRAVTEEADSGLYIEHYGVVGFERLGNALQFYELFNSYDGLNRRPLVDLELVGPPIDIDLLEIEFRYAIAAVWCLLQNGRAQS